VRRAKLGPDDPATLIALHNLAATYREDGQLAKALPLLEESLRLTKAKHGAGHPEVVLSLNSLGAGYQQAGRPDRAVPLLEEALPLARAKLGNNDPNTLSVTANLAACYWAVGELDKSIPLFEQALRLEESNLGRRHPKTQLTVANLGVNYKDAGQLAKALPLLEEAYQSSSHAWVGDQLLDAYCKAGKRRDAVRLTDALLAGTRATTPKDSPQLAGSLAQRGLGLLTIGAFSEAEGLFRESLAIREKQQPDAWNTFNAFSMLGGAILGQKKFADAEPLLLKGYEGMKAREKSIPPQANTRIPESLDRLIELYTATGKPDETRRWRAERAKYPFVAPPPREKK
jgi:tetratricopeptide (TPR) repeat protein